MTTAAQRQARARRRRRLGLARVVVELDEARLARYLLNRGLVDEKAALDPIAIAGALESVIKELLQ
jgi:hypothetical protein